MRTLWSAQWRDSEEDDVADDVVGVAAAAAALSPWPTALPCERCPGCLEELLPNLRTNRGEPPMLLDFPRRSAR